MNDGGPAFPRPVGYAERRYRTDQQWMNEPQAGMTLRDYFAGQALSGWLASFGEDAMHPVSKSREGDIAFEAYRMADAMLAERAKKGAS